MSPSCDTFLPFLDHADDPQVRQARAPIEQPLGTLGKSTSAAAQWYSQDALRTLADGAQVVLLYAQAEHGGEWYAKLVN